MRKHTKSNKDTLTSDIKKLNKLASMISATSQHYEAAMNENRHKDVETIGKNIALIRNEFISLLGRMPKLKFDYVSGDYFPAKDELGRAVFHIQVTESTTAVFEIATADGIEAAKREAVQRFRTMKGAGNYIPGARDELKTEDVGSIV